MSFGESAALYNLIRQAYSEEVIDKVVSILGTVSAYPVLDIGCGTGTATRQLARRDFVTVGVDIDSDMIEEARSLGGAGEYHTMSADGLNFPDAQFGGATAFGSFHWFSDETSIRHILRVLRPGAAFIVVNKNDTGDFRDVIVGIVSRHVALEQAHPKARYQPIEILRDNDFKSTQKSVISVAESLSAEQAIAHVRSMRLWGEVPAVLHDVIEAELRDYVESRLSVSGRFERQLDVTVVSGHR